VFTARYGLIPYMKHICLFSKWFINSLGKIKFYGLFIYMYNYYCDLKGYVSRGFKKLTPFEIKLCLLCLIALCLKSVILLAFGL
jgi:hypothetical protein